MLLFIKAGVHGDRPAKHGVVHLHDYVLGSRAVTPDVIGLVYGLVNIALQLDIGRVNGKTAVLIA